MVPSPNLPNPKLFKPPLPKQIRRDKCIGVAVTSAQYDQLVLLGEILHQPKVGKLVYSLVDKALEDNKTAIQQYQVVKQNLKL